MNLRATALLLTSLGLVTPALIGCAAGGSAETRNIRQVTDGVEKDLEAIKVRNVKVVALPDGSATLVGFLVNQSDAPDQLVNVTVNNQTALLQGDGILLRNRPVIFEGDSANAKAKVAILDAKPGYRVPVALYFANGGKLELDALVVENTGIYSSIL
ncbi:MAG: hypothetical protein FJW46_06335 [Actinobacteria bacterium]|nr:hypothetical protein [Actinomycetota bacterium]